MSVQLTLNLGYSYKKRVRYEVPKCLNFYTLYQYDRKKFRTLLNSWLKSEDGKNRTSKSLQIKQNEILEKCFIRDDNGNKLRDSDEKHIFRYRTLHKIYEKIYNEVKLQFLKNGKIYSVDGFTNSVEEHQAWIDKTDNLSIKDRIVIHIRLLRLLRKGLSIKEALYEIKNA